MAEDTKSYQKWQWLAPEKEPHWWKYLNPVFSETNEVINLTSSAGETSFVRNEEDDDDEDIPTMVVRKV